MFLQTDNQFIARGRIARDPFVNYSKNGNLVTTITLAQQTPFKNENNEYTTAFISYTAIDTQKNKIATRLAEYAVQGTPISLIGYHDSYSYMDDNGKEQYPQINRISQFRIEENKAAAEKRKNNLEKN